MYGDEFSKIKAAVDEYQRSAGFIEDLQRRRQTLDVHRKDGELIQVAFVGNSGKIDVPEVLQVHLAHWLDTEFAKLQSQAAEYQRRLTCPPGTNDR